MRTLSVTVAIALALLALGACRHAKADPTDHRNAAAMHVGTDPGQVGAGTPLVARPGDGLAAFAGGCFWGTEDVFRHVPGVVATAVGYTGGHTTFPTYEQVSSHTTGHAETVLVEFDPRRVTYAQLLHVFFTSHDPTTLESPGPGRGEQLPERGVHVHRRASGGRTRGQGGSGQAAWSSCRDAHRAHRPFLEGGGLPPTVRRADRLPLLSLPG